MSVLSTPTLRVLVCSGTLPPLYLFKPSVVADSDIVKKVMSIFKRVESEHPRIGFDLEY
jgi:hypothetical protein